MDAYAAIIAGIASIIVAILQIRANSREKQKNVREQEKNEADELREQIRQKEERERTELLQEQTEKITRIEASVEKLADKVGEIMDKTEDQDRIINNLTAQLQTTTDIILEHQRATSGVINAIAEGFRDDNVKGSLTTAIQNYHAAESDVLSKAYKASMKNTNADQ